MQITKSETNAIKRTKGYKLVECDPGAMLLNVAPRAASLAPRASSLLNN